MTADPSRLALRAEAAQRRAADPRASAWVAASAGSGKTKVLTDRVLRLLLAGTPPERILCLTFTKAAAAEMADRLFVRLSRWAAASAEGLAADLLSLLGREPEGAESERARQLFAAVLDAPESVRIETLHGFAQGILRRFPVEAGVSPTFEVLDDRSAEEMLRRARERVFRDARPGSPEEAAIAAITARVVDSEFPRLVAAITGARVRIGRMLRAWGGATALADGLARHLGLAPGATEDGVLAAACRDAAMDAAALRALAAAMIEQGSDADAEKAAGIAAFLAAPEAERPARWGDYVSVFLTGKGEARSTERYPTKKVKAAFPDAVAVLTAEQARLLAAEDRLAAARLLTATARLMTLAEAILSAYEAEKRRAGWLDYDDLIGKALALLASAEARPWVLYKLDGGLDHILVDEAQDTSHDQWAVVEALSAEFLEGEGARGELVRTVFAVGDVSSRSIASRGDPAVHRQRAASRRRRRRRGAFRIGAAGHPSARRRRLDAVGRGVRGSGGGGRTARSTTARRRISATSPPVRAPPAWSRSAPPARARGGGNRPPGRRRWAAERSRRGGAAAAILADRIARMVGATRRRGGNPGLAADARSAPATSWCWCDKRDFLPGRSDPRPEAARRGGRRGGPPEPCRPHGGAGLPDPGGRRCFPERSDWPPLKGPFLGWGEDV
jgi:ATP-dependent helicase/nuclease subunit A